MKNNKMSMSTGLLASSAAAQQLLYTSAYEGDITTLSLMASNGSLVPIATNQGCAPNPSWVELDAENGLLYCTDEGWNTPTVGHLTSFSTSANGVLTQIGKTEVPGGPVKIAPFGAGGLGLAVPGYSGAAVGAATVTLPGQLELTWSEEYTMASPGPVPDRQDQPHPHDTITDPTGGFVVVPDLGADLLRLYSVGAEDHSLTTLEPVSVAPGSGPRHGAFNVVGDRTFFYLVAELDNTVTGFEVKYGGSGAAPAFEELFSIPTHGEGEPAPTGAAASEIAVTPDGSFLIVASRLESSITIPSFNGTGASIPSDPLITFSIDSATGSLTKVGEFPAGGVNPRHFSISPEGDTVAVALQADGRVVLYPFDGATGELGEEATAWIEGMGSVSCVIFG